MSQNFVGRWKQTSRSNIEGLLDLYGVTGEKREAVKARLSNQEMEIELTSDTSGSLGLVTPQGVHKMPFTLGEPFEYTMSSGRKVKATMTKETDCKLNISLAAPEDPKFVGGKATCEVCGDDITMTQTFGPVTSVVKYKKA